LHNAPHEVCKGRIENLGFSVRFRVARVATHAAENLRLGGVYHSPPERRTCQAKKFSK
jgi:hypothetical protein